MGRRFLAVAVRLRDLASRLTVPAAMGGVGVCQLRVPMDDCVMAMAVMMVVVVMVMRTGGRDCRRAKQHDDDRGGEPDHYEPRSLLASVGWLLLCGPQWTPT